MGTAEFLLVAALVFGYSLIAGRLEHSIISGPMVLVTAGWLFGPDMLGWIETEISSAAVEVVMALALTLVLFTDAARIELRLLRREFRLPLRNASPAAFESPVSGTR